jgi:tetratricopeptide (TPR) repeat protein
MISNFTIERNEANRTWQLTQLLEDLQAIKGGSLSMFESNCLYGLLCRYNLSNIADKLGWSVNSLRTELSRGLYIYIKELLNRDTIVWNRIADWLEPIYGKAIEFKESPTYEIEDKYRSSSLIALVLNQQLADRHFPLENSQDEDNEVSSLLGYGNLRLKSGDFLEAIKAYKEALERDLSQVRILNKIASCLYKLGFHDDVCEICNFLLCHTQKDEIKRVTYNFLGLINRDGASQQYNNLQIDCAVYYFTKARELSGSDVVPAWNIVEILLQFRNHNYNYLQRAKLAVSDLFRIAEHPESNFHCYQKQILLEAEQLFTDLDEWWKTVYSQLERLKDRSILANDINSSREKNDDLCNNVFLS